MNLLSLLLFITWPFLVICPLVLYSKYDVKDYIYLENGTDPPWLYDKDIHYLSVDIDVEKDMWVFKEIETFLVIHKTYLITIFNYVASIIYAYGGDFWDLYTKLIIDKVSLTGC